ncbi:hypothetical protein [Psychromonas sp. MME2]|uniref:hypothetical protein n=1 Tax=unclassified Psychromonas TaxID=2614957 RepID=UPI00339CC405
MQINGYQQIQLMPTSTSVVDTAKTTPTVTAEPGVQVNFSAQAIKLAESENASIKTAPLQSQNVTLPEQPDTPLTGEKLQQYVQFKKAQAQYQIHADMANILTGNGDGISAPTAYYLSTNEDARGVVLQQHAMQQQAENMQRYQESTQAINERYKD